MAEDILEDTQGGIRLPARITLFGSASRDALLRVTPRPRAQRATRALVYTGFALLLAPLAALIPPHVPWAIVVLALGAWRAHREWLGEYELHVFEGECPRCGEKLKLDERYVTLPHVVPCYACHAQPQLTTGGPT